ncbi:MAG: diadenylate cyclase CdaA [Lachnospiraceae bacterium]|nr:diadenylate cyclase CdaA [Lachnospiraceae bacterium]MBQ8667939.1 diadenylate cyclase CdaA [Lachnospiraceae bacterium]
MSEIIESITSFVERYVTWLSIPSIKWTDIVEILIISVLLYKVLSWIKESKAWSLLKGIVFILLFVMVAAMFSMTTILWIAKNIFSVAVTAMVVVFQPELRKALEQLGRRKVLSSLFQFDNRVSGERFSDETINEIARGSFEMGRAKTGALIVIAQNDPLTDYEKTGIMLDSAISSQLLINIFEHNTPLHDGAVIVQGNRIVAATCYLPLSENMALSKELGTRHRAGVGISEVTDSMTVIVSEETGRVSVAYEGELTRNVDVDELKEMLRRVQGKTYEEKKSFRLFKRKAEK